MMFLCPICPAALCHQALLQPSKQSCCHFGISLSTPLGVAVSFCPLLQFVAKRYKKPVERAVYFADAVLQMDAKFLGKLHQASYNKLYNTINMNFFYIPNIMYHIKNYVICWDGHQGVC
jgi:hypothetical protein